MLVYLKALGEVEDELIVNVTVLQAQENEIAAIGEAESDFVIDMGL